MSEVKPAFTDEEWRVIGVAPEGFGDWASAADRDLHRTAALVLHNQEFGFTHEMAEAITFLATPYAGDPWAGLSEGERAAEMERITTLAIQAAERIVALLPPRDESGRTHES